MSNVSRNVLVVTFEDAAESVKVCVWCVCGVCVFMCMCASVRVYICVCSYVHTCGSVCGWM